MPLSLLYSSLQFLAQILPRASSNSPQSRFCTSKKATRSQNATRAHALCDDKKANAHKPWTLNATRMKESTHVVRVVRLLPRWRDKYGVVARFGVISESLTSLSSHNLAAGAFIFFQNSSLGFLAEKGEAWDNRCQWCLSDSQQYQEVDRDPLHFCPSVLWYITVARHRGYVTASNSRLLRYWTCVLATLLATLLATPLLATLAGE